MNLKQLGLGIVLVDFLALSGYAMYYHGFAGMFTVFLTNAATVAGLADLTIALGLVSIWIVQDARARGESGIPWVVLTALVGSPAALLYLIRRESRSHAASRPRVAQPVRA
jgi:hypothetical protein